MTSTNVATIPVNKMALDNTGENRFYRIRALITFTIFANSPDMDTVRSMEETLISATESRQKMQLIVKAYNASRNKAVTNLYDDDLRNSPNLQELIGKRRYLSSISNMNTTYNLNIADEVERYVKQIDALISAMRKYPPNDPNQHHLDRIGNEVFEKVVALAIAALTNNHRKQILRFEPGNTPAP